jgi:hypothetical protein
LDVKERVGSIADTVRTHRLESKVEDADREVLRLRTENDALRATIDETRPKKHRVRRLMTLGIAAGGAYMLGAKAGRERYEQLRDKWRSMRGTATDSWESASTAVTSTVEKAADLTEHGAKKVQQVASTTERKADQVEHKARNASTGTTGTV